MIALGLQYLTGYAVANDIAAQRAEWPPHPGRVFLAMAAAHFETGSDPLEREALEWLETAPAPLLRVSDGHERSSVRSYVPVNDDHGGIVKRSRQDRAFPRFRPDSDSVFLLYPDSDPPADIREALDRLCRKVTRVGHSTSAVQMWVVNAGEEPEPNLLYANGGSEFRLRVAGPGTLQLLVESFNADAILRYDRLSEEADTAKGKEKKRLQALIVEEFGGRRPESRRPQLSEWQGYRRPAAAETAQVIPGPFDPLFLVLSQVDGPVLALEETLRLTLSLRNAAMKAAGNRVGEWLSGHDEEGRPTTAPHVAFFPLPHVGFEFADGHVMGLGVAVPAALSEAEDLRRVFGALLFDSVTGEERDVMLWDGRKWKVSLRREIRERPARTLQCRTWAGASRWWASVTPAVFHHYPKKNRPGDTERILRQAFVSAGFPEPLRLATRPVSAVTGAGHAASLPPFTEGGEGMCRYQAHVVAEWGSPVQGPMLIGRGRFRGYGLMRPMRREEVVEP